VDVDATEIRARWCGRPGAAQQVDSVTASHQAREDFPEMELGAPGLGIFLILPVQY
jgi:hypothetical protein